MEVIDLEKNELNMKKSANDTNNNEKQFDFFEKMPNEILLHIFRYLVPSNNFHILKLLCPVSKRFNQMSWDPSFHRKFRIPIETRMSLTKAHEVLDKLPLLTELSIVQRSDADLLAIYAIEKCPKLTKLEIYKFKKLGHIFFETIDEFGSSLRHLNLYNCSVEDGLWVSHSRCLGKLTHLELFNFWMENAELRSIVDHCGPNLELFNIQEVTRLSDETLQYLLESSKFKLKHLYMDGESLDDRTFSKLQFCQKLQSLKVLFAEKMCSDGLQSISKLSQLTTLKISRAKELTNDDFELCFRDEKLKHLKKLDLRECIGLRDTGLVAIAKNCPMLENLCLNWCWELTDFSVHVTIRTCQKLKVLKLIGISHLTNDGIFDIDSFLPNLKQLNLQQCPNIEDIELKELVTSKRDLSITDYYGNYVSPHDFNN